ncbi:MAG: hypothetical protein ACOCVN_00815 [bacterium]
MKNEISIIKVVLFIVIITTLSCKKETGEFEYISQVPDPIAEYSKELTASDSSQKNTVFLLVSSNDEKLLNHYFDYVSIKLEIAEKELKNEFGGILNKTKIDYETSNNIDSICEEFKIDLESEEKIFIELIASNLESNVEYYYLSMHPTNIKSYWPFDTPAVEFITSSDFVGVVHSGYGNPFLKG